MIITATTQTIFTVSFKDVSLYFQAVFSWNSGQIIHVGGKKRTLEISTGINTPIKNLSVG